MPQPVQHQQVRPHHHTRSTSAQQSSLERHRRKCAVCHHPERESIEEEFLHWHNPVNIVHEFDLGDRRILYRHAHATGLYDQRRRNYLFTIENVLECGDDIEFTAAAYIKAVRAYACLCDTVRWNEPVTCVQHDYHVHTDTAVPGASTSDSSPESRSCRSGEAGVGTPSSSRADAGELRHNNRSRESSPGIDSVAVPSSSLPQAASDEPARSAVSSSRVTRHEPGPAPAKKQQAVASGSASSVSSADSGEKFLAAAIPLLGAKPKHVAQLKKAGLLHLSELAARHVSPASNRHTPELETGVSHGKQRSEVVSNRHKIAK